MKKKKLGVNIDHVATIRNARGEKYPDPLRAALFAEKSGANSITIHLREDRRHIKDNDLINIKKKLNVPLNLEMAPINEMLKIAIKHKPNYVCIVPEKRAEITTEGGLNLKKNNRYLKKIINELKKNNIRVYFDDKNQSIGKKVRESIMQKIPYAVTIGDKEVKAKKLAIRSLDGKLKFGVSTDKFIKDLASDIEHKC